MRKKSKNFRPQKQYIFTGNIINEDYFGYKLIYNDTNKWIKYVEDCSGLKNAIILSPYLNEIKNNELDFFVPPKEFNIIIGICIDSKLPFNFELKSQKYNLESIPQNILNNTNKSTIINEYTNNSFFYGNGNHNIANFYNYIYDYDFIFTSLAESKKNIFPYEANGINETNNNINSNIKYPKILILLENLPKSNSDNNSGNLIWSIDSNKTLEYIGQMNINKEREGKGCLIYKNSDHVLIGVFKKGKINGNGIVYNKDLNKVYFVGNFVEGKKNGKGILYFNNGDRYEGEFENNKRNGKGVYFFKTEKGEQKWEGFFCDGYMDGEGFFTDYNGKKEIIKYIKGKQVI